MKKVLEVLGTIVKWYFKVTAVCWAAVGIGRIIDTTEVMVNEYPDSTIVQNTERVVDTVWETTINAFKKFFGWFKK